MRRRLGIAVALGVLALPAPAAAAPGLLSAEGMFAYVEVKNGKGDVVARRRPSKPRVRMLRHLSAAVYPISAGRVGTARCSRRVHVLSWGLTAVHVTWQRCRRCSMSRR